MVTEGEHWGVWTRVHNPEKGAFEDLLLVYHWAMPKAEAEAVMRRLSKAYDDGNLFLRKV